MRNSIEKFTKNIPTDIDGFRKVNDGLISTAKEILSVCKGMIKVNSDLTEINRDIIKVNEQLTYNQIQQKELVSIMSHELRGPIQSILGYTDFLDLNPINSKDYINRIKENTERLNALVLDILDVTRIENNLFTLNMTLINLTDVIFTAIEDITQKIKDSKKKINIHFTYNNKYIRKEKESDIPPNSDKDYKNIAILGDKQRLTQVLFNLLDNAIKFTHEGMIRVNLEKIGENIITNNNNSNTHNKNNKYSKANDNNQIQKEIVVVKIKDSGKGIDSKVFSNLFSKFNSGHGSGGTGLGLFISKNIIQGHGGNMWAENNKEELGATFYFSLPLK